MGFERSLIKEESKSIIKGDLKRIFIMGLAITIISGSIPLVDFPFIIDIILSVLVFIPKIGFYHFALNKENGKEGSLDDLTYGFEYFEKIIILNIVQIILITIGYMLFFIPGVILTLMFSMSNIILAENPKKSVEECLRESKELTNGMKGSLFIFYLSFILWVVFAEMAWYIPFCLVTPYILISEVKVYRKLKSNFKSENMYVENENFTNSKN